MMKLLLNLPLRTLIPGILIVFSTLVGVAVTLDRLQREQADIVRTSQLNMVELMEQVQEGLSDRMLHGDLLAANLRISSAALARNVNELHLIDDEGVIRLSSQYAIRGKPVAGMVRHFDAAVATESEVHERVIVKVSPDRRDMHGYFPIVLGQERGALRPNRYGVLFVDYDLSKSLATARSHAIRQSLIFFSAFMLLTLLLVAFFRWRVTRRVETLAGTVSRFAKGDLTQRASLAGSDELAYLAVAFNDMAVHLEDKNRQLQAEVEERKVAEQALRNSRQMLQLVLDSIPVGVFWKDASLTYLGCNRMFVHDAGLPSPETVVGMREADLVWQQLAERYEADDLQVITSGQAKLHSEEMTVMPNGEVVWLQISKIPLRDDGGKITGLLGTYQNITARKHSEEALRKSAEEIEDLYEHAPCGYHSLDKDGVFLRINHTELRWLGYTREEMVGKMKFSDIITPASLEVFKENYPHFKETGIVRDLKFELIRKDGTILPVVVSATAIYDADHQYVTSRSTVYDITELKRTEEALQHLNETLEQRIREELAKSREKDHLLIQQSRLAAMGEMVHNIAHQWRQPLNVLGLVISGIKDDFEYGSLTRENLQEAVDTAQRLLQKMSTTIDDFRNFFRPDKEKQDFDIAKVVKDTAVLMEASLKNNAIALELELDEPVVAEGYPSQYSQALLNLIVNAKEAIQQGRITHGSIRIRLHRHEGKAVLSVEDNAGGISPAVMPHMFEPYFTTKEQGSGIGLYMTRMIIESNMQGRVKVENTEQGAKLTLMVPLAEGGHASST